MMTVKEMSRRTGLSVRTLQYYDNIGLLKAAAHTEAGYRLYDEAALERLQQILLFRELEFPLKDIKTIFESPGFDREKALEQQISLLEMKKERLEQLLTLARGIQNSGGNDMDFSPFDSSKLDAYARQAREQWGTTPAYAEFAEKSKGRSREAEKVLGAGLMEIFARLGAIRDSDPAGEAAQALVGQLQSYITEHYYNCTHQILGSLGQMYAAGGAFTENIDAAGGEGTAAFVNRAIEAYCGK